MHTNNFLQLVVFLVLSACQYAVAHGGMEGGGGKGVLCGTQVRVLDLYEAETIHHLPIPTSQNDLDANVAHHALALGYYQSETGFDQNNASYKELIFNFYKQEVIDKFSDIAPGTRLPFTPDATLPNLPSGCSFVQIALYADDGVLYRDRYYWDRLTIQDQAALILHEGIYRGRRLQGELMSDETRYIVGLTFARQLPEPIFKPMWNAPGSWWCGTKDPMTERFELYAINESRNGKSGLGIYFVTFKNYFQYERTSAFVPGIAIRDLFIGKTDFSAQVHSYLTNRNWVLEYTGAYSRKDNSTKIRAWSQGDPATKSSSADCELRMTAPSLK
ncbi:MAG TPA: hypothetical protein VIG33_03630 [Pseudobdellovibrionaceae bacterium]|jgi:hypothetical protein